ncbi:protein of unknown function [Taphrina deformans PYCC 5710]|uniref:Glycosyl transferase CAP10 domain-containing protein n=1 Tax=Taphrina deformans (strain PYCC 5710 / ATCC 11124 / CBS 356.35 / IMI 108563 / JCM 9778 / NBRC 8474) TaxID=1097556 RepID=R4XEN4_TAPDE|nr:protein of unknown function [Taphrina deformans PYCC 5710]|eukprot:CCG84236.1 protein of unknown function [Taphrina deformans PYCC 5710]
MLDLRWTLAVNATLLALQLLELAHRDRSLQFGSYIRVTTVPSALLVAAVLHRKKRKDESIASWIVLLVAGLFFILGKDWVVQQPLYLPSERHWNQIGQEIITGTLIAILLHLFEVLQLSTGSQDIHHRLEDQSEETAHYRSASGPLRQNMMCLGLSCTIQLAFVLSILSFTGELRTSVPTTDLLSAILQDASLLLGSLLLLCYLRLDALATILSLSTCATFGIIATRGTSAGDYVVALSIILGVASVFEIKNLPSRRYIAIAYLLLLCCYFTAVMQNTAEMHPWSSLRQKSRTELSAFEGRETKVDTLERAYNDYIDRYGRLPPPGFDKWYEYAKEHNAAVVSNYDQINRDLTPFWNIKPAEIRKSTYKAVQNRYNYLAPLTIRKGKVTSPPMEQPTHYWQLESLMKMMQEFVPFLPDMDIAINLNDEPRVLAQSKVIATKVNDASQVGGPFTLNATNWAEEIPFTDSTHESFTKQERRLQNVYDYCTRFCPSASLARLQYTPMRAVEPFYAVDGSLSLDICQHPEVKNTRGFFVSPTSFDITDELLPVFSQSKPSTFSDIIIPSPWNFQDKVGDNVIDEVSWEDKYDRVHWRGSASEGWAIRGSWKKMLRQSLVDFMGGAKQEAKQFTPSRTMLYEGTDVRGYKARSVPVRELQEALSPDVFFVGIGRADDSQEAQQQEHFHLQESNDFSTHWQYRYLLDTDGAGFSGRFLSFVESQSLPLKLNSIFTEWWVDRIIPHQHFVPVTLSSLYSTWIYFVGLKDKSGKVVVEGHQGEARQIAQDGRAWAKKALRKDDMVIYLWRLLLEYGRVVDDDRDNIGHKHTA